jgi:hypothetical protein
MQNAPVLCQNKSSLTDLANDLFIYVPVEVIPIFYALHQHLVQKMSMQIG